MAGVGFRYGNSGILGHGGVGMAIIGACAGMLGSSGDGRRAGGIGRASYFP